MIKDFMFKDFMFKDFMFMDFDKSIFNFTFDFANIIVRYIKATDSYTKANLYFEHSFKANFGHTFIVVRIMLVIVNINYFIILMHIMVNVNFMVKNYL